MNTFKFSVKLHTNKQKKKKTRTNKHNRRYQRSVLTKSRYRHSLYCCHPGVPSNHQTSQESHYLQVLDHQKHYLPGQRDRNPQKVKFYLLCDLNQMEKKKKKT